MRAKAARSSKSSNATSSRHQSTNPEGIEAMFIGPCYTLKNNGVSISTAISVIQLKLGTNGPGELLRASQTQGSSTTSSQIAAKIVRKTAAATVTAGVAGTARIKKKPLHPPPGAPPGHPAPEI